MGGLPGIPGGVDSKGPGPSATCPQQKPPILLSLQRGSKS
ncbi:rCG32246 [Rattus norvegicus]|uniref:RCG32246 n=1 Tax=Rattus norvegicus TaxID=10116 RepID=A6JXE5_RAT|nr:rCG32246 [Rattus norvegicus]